MTKLLILIASLATFLSGAAPALAEAETADPHLNDRACVVNANHTIFCYPVHSDAIEGPSDPDNIPARQCKVVIPDKKWDCVTVQRQFKDDIKTTFRRLDYRTRKGFFL